MDSQPGAGEGGHNASGRDLRLNCPDPAGIYTATAQTLDHPWHAEICIESAQLDPEKEVRAC